MSWFDKVVWSEGLFLRAHHFQQAERHAEHRLERRVADLSAYGWGMADLLVNRDMLDIGKFGLSRARGVFPDGFAFSLPDDRELPPPLDIPPTARDLTIFLAVPVQQPGAVTIAPVAGQDHAARYDVSEITCPDTVGGSDSVARIAVARPRLRYLLSSDDREGYVTLAVAHIAEMQPGGRAVLDDRFIPPCLNSRASPVLAGYVAELQGILKSRGDALGGRIADATGNGVGDIAEFLLLQLINRHEPLFAHLSSLPALHPERLYAVMVGLAGELASFTGHRRRPGAFPVYTHDDLQGCFAPVVAALRQSLGSIFPISAISLPLQELKYGVKAAQLNDREMLRSCFFVLAVRADMAAESVRQHFPNQVKIGPIEQIRDLVSAAIPGIPLVPMSVAPRQIPYHAGSTYFELERNSSHWTALATSAALAIHVAGTFPGLTLELWAIKS